MQTNPIEEYPDDLDAYIAKRNETEATLKKVGQEAVLKRFKEFFASHPNVEKIIFTAYTPYFMDGDPCEYSVSEYRYKIDNIPEIKNTDYNEDEDDYYSLPHAGTFIHKFGTKIEGTNNYNYTYKKNEKGEIVLTKYNKLYQDLITLERTTSDENLCRQLYGDHVKVIVDPNMIVIEDYDHD